MHNPSGRLIAAGVAALLAAGCITRHADSSAAAPPRAAAGQPERPAPALPLPLADSAYKAGFKLEGAPPGPMKTGAQGRLTIRITNAGQEAFPARPVSASGIGAVYLSHHIFPAGSTGGPESATLWEGGRTPFAADLPPGGSVSLPLSFMAPDKAGKYDLHVDLVHEGIIWFSRKGNPELIVPIRVQ